MNLTRFTKQQYKKIKAEEFRSSSWKAARKALKRTLVKLRKETSN